MIDTCQDIYKDYEDYEDLRRFYRFLSSTRLVPLAKNRRMISELAYRFFQLACCWQLAVAAVVALVVRQLTVSKSRSVFIQS